jgi:hypothetical protein
MHRTTIRFPAELAFEKSVATAAAGMMKDAHTQAKKAGGHIE